MSQGDDALALPPEIWPALANRLWHATHIDQALAIAGDHEIRPNAPSKYTYGYCRSRGGVSLFDFREPEESAVKALSCGWFMWLSGHHTDGEDEIGTWFEIDPTLIMPDIPAVRIYQDWYTNRQFDERGELRFRDPMPYCEACYIGAIPLRAVKGVLLIDGRRLADYRYVAADENLSASISEFRACVRAKPPLPPTFADRLRDAQTRARRADAERQPPDLGH